MRWRRALLLAPTLLIAQASAGGCGSSDGNPEVPPPNLFDAQAPPGPSPTDPGRDGAAADSAVPSGPFCASQTPMPALCEDWDDGTPPPSATPDLQGGGACAIDGTVFLSSPSSYKCVSPGGNPFSNALLGIATNAPASTRKASVAFSFRPTTAPPTSGDLVIARVFVSGTRSITIELSSEVGAVVREQEGGTDNPSAPFAQRPTPGSFQRYALAIDVTAKTAKLQVDGADAATLALKGTTVDRVALNLGLQSSAAFTAYYDDVVIDWP